MTNLLTTTSFESKKHSCAEDIQISNISGGTPIPIVAFKNGGTAVHDFKGPYLTQTNIYPGNMHISEFVWSCSIQLQHLFLLI